MISNNMRRNLLRMPAWILHLFRLSQHGLRPPPQPGPMKLLLQPNAGPSASKTCRCRLRRLPRKLPNYTASAISRIWGSRLPNIRFQSRHICVLFEAGVYAWSNIASRKQLTMLGICSELDNGAHETIVSAKSPLPANLRGIS